MRSLYLIKSWYVRFATPHGKKYYFPKTPIGVMSRRSMKRARDAEDYAKRVTARYDRLMAAKIVLDKESNADVSPHEGTELQPTV